mgnify:CR=1 FL=1
MTTRALLILAAALAGCPTADPDGDRVQPPDDDDDTELEANWSGSVTWWSDDSPAVGLTVGLGGRTTETDADGAWALPGPDEGPVQIDHYDDGNVRSGIGCGGPHEQVLYDFGGAGVDGSTAVRFEVEGWTEATSIEIAFVYGAETTEGTTTVSRWIAAGDLTDEGDGVAATTMTVTPHDWLVAVFAEVDTGALARVSIVETGPVEDGEVAVVAGALSSDGVVQATWDGKTRSGVANLRMSQRIPVPRDRTLSITTFDRAPTGDALPVGLYLPEGGTAELRANANLNDVWGCSSASASQSGLELGEGDTLSLPPFVDPMSVEPSTGEWGARPGLALGELDPSLEPAFVSISLGGAGGFWSTYSDLTCGLPDTLTFPSEWEDLSVGDFVYASAYIGLEGGSLSCSNFGEVQPL